VTAFVVLAMERDETTDVLADIDEEAWFVVDASSVEETATVEVVAACVEDAETEAVPTVPCEVDSELSADDTRDVTVLVAPTVVEAEIVASCVVDAASVVVTAAVEADFVVDKRETEDATEEDAVADVEA
jgi:hypothetical protein